ASGACAGTATRTANVAPLIHSGFAHKPAPPAGLSCVCRRTPIVSKGRTAGLTRFKGTATIVRLKNNSSTGGGFMSSTLRIFLTLLIAAILLAGCATQGAKTVGDNAEVE